jgi:L-ribulokinase
MGRSDKAVYQPIAANVKAYDELFADYTELHDHFGRGSTDIMHRLKARKRRLAARPSNTHAAEGNQHDI